MNKIKQLETLLQRVGKHKSDGMELILFMRAGEFGIGYFDSFETDSDHLDSEDCEYANSLEEVINKAIERWS